MHETFLSFQQTICYVFYIDWMGYVVQIKLISFGWYVV